MGTFATKSILSLMIASSLILCACEKKVDGAGTPDAAATDISGENDTDKTDDTKVWEKDSQEKEAFVTLEDADEQNEQINAGDYLKIYQNFLSGSEKVNFDLFEENSVDGRAAGNSWDLSTIAEQLKPGSSYTVSEFVQGLCQGYGAYFEIRNVLPNKISYSYIDCGKDGIPELAMEFQEIGDEGMADDFIVIMKVVDDKLQCIFSGRYGYRAYGCLGEYGIYTYSGSNGAASHSYMVNYVNAEGKTDFLYGVDDSLTASCLYIPGNNKYLEVADDEGIDEFIEIEAYYYELNNNQDYMEFLNNCDFVYYPLSENYNRLEGERREKALAGGAYKRFWDSTGLKQSTQEEVDKKIHNIYDKAGVTQDILNGADVNWIELSQSQVDSILSWEMEAEPITLSMSVPSWEYYYYGYEPEPSTRLTLKQSSKTPNEITDDYAWFEKVGINQPDRLCFSDGKYEYLLYGDDPDGLKWYPYMMNIYDYYSGDQLYTLDFSEYYIPDSYDSSDSKYVEEAVHWAVADDGILYVSHYHNTYAKSAPHNAYITAYDMNDNFKVLWRTKPLTCNSNNFVVTDDAIICGYGFTAEDDYIYVLDKGSGLRVGQYKVKTSPDWFYLKNNKLYVRCYDMDYEFDVNN